MNKLFHIFISIIIAGSLSSCFEDTIGSSLVESNLSIIADSSYTVSGNSVRNETILTRTMTQLLGEIKVENFGELKSDFVCQLLPSSAIDTTNLTVDMIESMKLIMRSPIGGYVGDSVMPMRTNVYQLSKQLSAPINSNFNPEGYFSTENLLGSTSYNATYSGSENLTHSTVQKGSYRTIVVNLPKEMAKKIFNEYKNNPATFKSTEKFNEFFPGIYVANSYGSGRITMIDKTFLLTNYKRHSKTEAGKDTIVKDSSSYATAAPEVITNNNITMKVDPKVMEMVANGDVILQAPLGYEAKIKFPIEELINQYKSDVNGLKVVNSLSFTIPAEVVKNDYNIYIPQYVLLVKESEKDKFFANNKLPDDINTFYAHFDVTSKTYKFENMRQFIVDLINNGSEEDIKDASNLMLVPVDVVSETNNSYYQTSTTITAVTPAVSRPMIGKLRLDKAKIRFEYSKKDVPLQ